MVDTSLYWTQTAGITPPLTLRTGAGECSFYSFRKTWHCKAKCKFVQTRGFGQINYSLAKFALHRNHWIPLRIWQYQHKPVILLSVSLFCIAICRIVQLTRCALQFPWEIGHFPPKENLEIISWYIISETKTDQNWINLKEFIFCALHACYSMLHKSVLSLCLAHTHGRYFTFHSSVMLPHSFNKHLILSLWLVPTNVWCRADGGFCVRRALCGNMWTWSA